MLSDRNKRVHARGDQVGQIKITHLNGRIKEGKVEMLEMFVSEENTDVFIVSKNDLTPENLSHVSLSNCRLLHSYCREGNHMGGIAVFGNIGSDIRDVKSTEMSGNLSEDFVFKWVDLSLKLNEVIF